MAIAVDEIDSPGWWLERLAQQLKDERPHMDLLMSYFEGDCPLPEIPAAQRKAFAAIVRKSRSNFAELIVRAVVDRIRCRAIRTAVDADDDGDELAWAMWRTNGLQVVLADALEWVGIFGRAYLIGGPVDEEDKQPVITIEDPRQVITEHDPARPRRIRAALKLFHDDASGEDVAYLYMPGQDGGKPRLYRATKPIPGSRRRQDEKPVRFNRTAWTWDQERGGEAGEELKRFPVVRLEAPHLKGFYEAHLDLLDRINHMILQYMVIATMQAFKQRGIIADLPEKDEDGNVIDYTDLFEASPSALWQLPEGAEMWESTTPDLTPILASVRDAILHLAAVTRTPLPMFTPDAVTQSAEGASASRETLVFKTEDQIERIQDPLATIIALGFAELDDEPRADATKVEFDWAPVERYSLSEKGAAATAAMTAGMPWRAIMETIFQFTPQQIARLESQRADDRLAAALALAQANAAAPAVPAAA